MCELEGGVGCVLFFCGVVVVVNFIFVFIEQGDYVLMINIVYELSQDFCSKIFSKLGVMILWFDLLIGVDIVKYLQLNIKIVFLELLGFIIMEVYDVSVIVVVVCSVVLDVIIMIDNIWVVGVLFKVLDFGIDVFI